MLVGGCGEKKVAEDFGDFALTRDVLEERDGVQYVKGETEPFAGKHFEYYEDGSKTWETPYVDGKEHGTQIWYREDGSKEREAVFENGNKISEKDF